MNSLPGRSKFCQSSEARGGDSVRIDSKSSKNGNNDFSLCFIDTLAPFSPGSHYPECHCLHEPEIGLSIVSTGSCPNRQKCSPAVRMETVTSVRGMYQAPAIWNHLPVSVRHSTSASYFFQIFLENLPHHKKQLFLGSRCPEIVCVCVCCVCVCVVCCVCVCVCV